MNTKLRQINLLLIKLALFNALCFIRVLDRYSPIDTLALWNTFFVFIAEYPRPVEGFVSDTTCHLSIISVVSPKIIVGFDPSVLHVECFFVFVHFIAV